GAGDRAADRRGAPADRRSGPDWRIGPDRGTPEPPHLARLEVTGTIELTDDALALYAATDPTSPHHRDDARTPDGTRAAGATKADATTDGATADGPTRSRRPRSPSASRGIARELVRAARAEGVRLRLIRDGDEYIGVMH